MLITMSGAPTNTIGHVSASAACVGGRGWYYETSTVVPPDAGADPSLEGGAAGGEELGFSVVVLCPSSCDTLASVANPRLDSLYGCPTTPAH